MPQVKCPMCQSLVAYAAGFSPVCPSCGYAGPLPASYAPPMPVSTGGPSLGVAVAGLVLNLVIWPGLGTLVAGQVGSGLAQGFLTLFGVLLFFTLIFLPIGVLLVVGMWVWGLVSGIQLVTQANARQARQPMPV